MAASAYDESGDLDAAKAVLAERDEYLQTGASGSTIPPVHLLALIDVSVHAPDRQWRKDGNALVSSPGPFTRIRIPYEPPASYDLQVQVERLGGASDFQIGLRSADRPFTVILDGWGASTSGISSIEGKLGNGNPSTFRGQVFQNQRPAIVKASIRPSGIKVTVDGKPVITWSGNPRSLSRGRETSNSLPFGVQKGAAYRISKAHLIPVTE